jgi:hypothetical protein
MTERFSHEIASLLADDDGRADRTEARALLRARLAASVSEGLGSAASVQGESAASDYDHARVAAFIDRAVSRAEWGAIAARLVDDPAVRSEVASAVSLLDSIEAQPDAMPAGLEAPAAGIFARSPDPAADGARLSAAWWRRSPAQWSTIAAVMLLAVVTPVVVSVILESRVAPEPGAADAPVGRTIAPPVTDKSSPGPAIDTRSCDDPKRPEASLQRPGDAKTAADRPGAQAPSGSNKDGEQASTQSPSPMPDDPCRPKAAVDDSRAPKRPPLSGRN